MYSNLNNPILGVRATDINDLVATTAAKNKRARAPMINLPLVTFLTAPLREHVAFDNFLNTPSSFITIESSIPLNN
jgi:hypothetical protein